MFARCLALLLVGLASPALAQGASPDLASRIDLSDFPVYSDPGGRFTLVYPVEWTETDPTGDACFFAGFVRQHYEGPPDAALISLTCDPYLVTAEPSVTDVAQVLGIDTEEGFQAFVVAAEVESGDDIEPLTREAAVLSGRPAFRWTYEQRITAVDGGVTLSALQHIVVADGTVYNITCMASKELWGQAADLCEALSRTLTVASSGGDVQE